ncbi:hypothetical protein Fmac_007705 [Flemingia macrophylla]|uniref:Uncharacterized protein n=1 Tax=Flemingia macrophylla TaxID=520843 RepID=A0ABD1MVB0_9FABA
MINAFSSTNQNIIFVGLPSVPLTPPPHPFLFLPPSPFLFLFPPRLHPHLYLHLAPPLRPSSPSSLPNFHHPHHHQDPPSSSSSSSPRHPHNTDDGEEVDKISLYLCFDSDDTASSADSSYRSTTSIREVDLIPSDTFYDLRCIAERMVSFGYLCQCIQVYANVRKSSVNASFRKLSVEKLSIGDVQHLEWEQRLKAWNR